MTIAERDDPSIAGRLRFNEIQYAAWLCRAMCTAATLKIADALGDEPMSVEALAARLGLHPPSLLRLLRALAANGTFEATGASTFRHNDMSRQLRTDHPFSLQPIAALVDSPLIQDSWDGLAGALQDGESGFSHRRGVSLYEHLRGNPADGAMFNGGMASYAVQPSAAIAALPLFRRARSVVDLGGGVGALAASIAAAHTDVRAIVLDLPHVQAGAGGYLARAGVADRVTFRAGDFFDSVPDGHDVYILKSILWNWGDERCLRLLQNVRRAVGDSTDARLLVIEPILLPSNLAWSSLFDLQMLAVTDSGRSRTDEEIHDLARRSGFALDSLTTVQDVVVAECSPT